jgi:predicted negative regulator of RcsB-dependent stress response
MTHRITILMTVVLAAALAGTAQAQQPTKDKVLLKSGQSVVGVVVTRETWEGVEVEKEGGAKQTYKYDDVEKVSYGAPPRTPKYLMDGQLLKREPKKLIDTLSRAYVDDSTPKCIRQHAYILVAQACGDLAKTGKGDVAKAVEAYDKLFTDIPDTCYAVTGRFDLANLLIELGQPDKAVKPLEVIASGKFGAKATREAKLLIAAADVKAKKYAEAEKLFADLAKEPAEDAEFKQQLELMRCRCQVEQKKLDEGYKGVMAVLAGKPSNKSLGKAYNILGDILAERGRYQEAATAFLKVPYMYPEAGVPEQVYAYQHAMEMFDKLGRAEDVKELKKELKVKFPEAGTEGTE